jgi:N-methylhydantoinase A/oxoprolinase/acetone carboxylase beta subunit
MTQAITRAAATAASGPAATAYFGARSSAANLAMVVDIGGKTTDITSIKNELYHTRKQKTYANHTKSEPNNPQHRSCK